LAVRPPRSPRDLHLGCVTTTHEKTDPQPSPARSRGSGIRDLGGWTRGTGVHPQTLRSKSARAGRSGHATVGGDGATASGKFRASPDSAGQCGSTSEVGCEQGHRDGGLSKKLGRRSSSRRDQERWRAVERTPFATIGGNCCPETGRPPCTGSKLTTAAGPGASVGACPVAPDDRPRARIAQGGMRVPRDSGRRKPVGDEVTGKAHRLLAREMQIVVRYHGRPQRRAHHRGSTGETFAIQLVPSGVTYEIHNA